MTTRCWKWRGYIL